MTGYSELNRAYLITGADLAKAIVEQKFLKNFMQNDLNPFDGVLIKPINGLSMPQSQSNNYSTCSDSNTLVGSISSVSSSLKSNSFISQISPSSCRKMITDDSKSVNLALEGDKYSSASTKSFQPISPKEKLPQLNQISYPNSNTILNSTAPLDLTEQETITIQGETGILANKSELINWSGPLSLKDYPINEDPNPEVIIKKPDQKLEYNQEIAIRYLRPPTPAAPGDLIIRHEKNFLPPPAPPLVIRQQPPRPDTPPPLVIREAPPKKPLPVETKVITIAGKKLPPPPRKVIIERLAPLPPKPQPVIIERWLPYKEHKRKVVYQKPTVPEVYYEKPRNLIIQWEPPAVTINKDYKNLGVVKANPDEYFSRYGNSLKNANELPDFGKISPPDGISLASETPSSTKYDLEGDLEALALIDLDKEGLSEYKNLIQKNNNSKEIVDKSIDEMVEEHFRKSMEKLEKKIENSEIDSLISEIIYLVKMKTRELISYYEAKLVVKSINEKLNRDSDERNIQSFLKSINLNQEGSISVKEFREALLKSLENL